MKLFVHLAPSPFGKDGWRFASNIMVIKNGTANELGSGEHSLFLIPFFKSSLKNGMIIRGVAVNMTPMIYTVLKDGIVLKILGLAEGKVLKKMCCAGFDILKSAGQHLSRHVKFRSRGEAPGDEEDPVIFKQFGLRIVNDDIARVFHMRARSIN